ncbi:MAG: glycosyltransferase family 2 protein [Aquabacterium sp.]|nr:glycosyltransferase family 2 protein [Aquabacterium sp.]
MSVIPIRHDLPADLLRGARGRWLLLRLSGIDARQAVYLVLHGAPGHWPDVQLPLQAEPHGARVWVHVGMHTSGLSLHGDAAALSRLGPVTGSTADVPATWNGVAPAMRSAAHLQQLGVCALHEVAFGDTMDWPLIATGNDPQLMFLPLDRAATLRIELGLAVENRPDAQPCVYWAPPGAGFQAQASALCQRADAPLSPDGTQCHVATLPTLKAGSSWRLDPIDSPGRFRITAVHIGNTAVRREPGGMRLALDWLAAHQPARGIDTLLPAKDLHLTNRAKRRYLATSNDPQMRLSAPLAPGWYMLELQLHLPGTRSRVRIYLNDGSGESEERAWTLPLKSGRTGKRLLWVEHRSQLRLDPTTAAGEFTLGHFRLQRVGKGFARERLRRKLDQAPTGRAPGELWASYCNLFEPHHEGAISYADWIAEVEQPAVPSLQAQAAQMLGWQIKPLISVVVPVYDTPLEQLRACLDSVLAQTYPHWELCVADDASPNPAVRELLQAVAQSDPRVHLCLRQTNGHITQASNNAIALASGEFIALLDHDDTLAPHALFAIVERLQQRPQAQIVYSDEDKLDTQGRRCDPFFKPDWAPDLLLSQNYVSHLGVYRRSLVEAVGGFRAGFEGAQDYDLLLRCVACIDDPADILHVPQVLYHWRKSAGSTAADHAQKPYATEAALQALQAHADMHTPGVLVSVIAPGLYRQHWPLPDPPPLVSLIVPTRDGGDTLRQCIDSILQRTSYVHYEILVVDNQSCQPQTMAYLAGLPAQHPGRIRVLRFDHPFNYAAINNLGVAEASGSIVGLINDDVEVISPEWLGEMVGHVLRPDIGCVGAKLYYPDDTVQHAGVVLGIGGIAGHSHKYFDRSDPGYFGRLRIAHDVSAVTGAVLMVRKSVYEAVGGLDAEHLHVAFNDVDFCLKVREAGWRNLFTPFAELYHHESKTRGLDSTDAKRARFLRECETMTARWHGALGNDPFYNQNLSLQREDYSLAAGAGQAREMP